MEYFNIIKGTPEDIIKKAEAVYRNCRIPPLRHLSQMISSTENDSGSIVSHILDYIIRDHRPVFKNKSLLRCDMPVLEHAIKRDLLLVAFDYFKRIGSATTKYIIYTHDNSRSHDSGRLLEELLKYGMSRNNRKKYLELKRENKSTIFDPRDEPPSDRDLEKIGYTFYKLTKQNKNISMNDTIGAYYMQYKTESNSHLFSKEHYDRLSPKKKQELENEDIDKRIERMELRRFKIFFLIEMLSLNIKRDVPSVYFPIFDHILTNIEHSPFVLEGDSAKVFEFYDKMLNSVPDTIEPLNEDDKILLSYNVELICKINSIARISEFFKKTDFIDKEFIIKTASFYTLLPFPNTRDVLIDEFLEFASMEKKSINSTDIEAHLNNHDPQRGVHNIVEKGIIAFLQWYYTIIPLLETQFILLLNQLITDKSELLVMLKTELIKRGRPHSSKITNNSVGKLVSSYIYDNIILDYANSASIRTIRDIAESYDSKGTKSEDTESEDTELANKKHKKLKEEFKIMRTEHATLFSLFSSREMFELRSNISNKELEQVIIPKLLSMLVIKIMDGEGAREYLN